MKKVIALSLAIILNSCLLFQENGIEFTIKNNSDFSIKDVKFTTSEMLISLEYDFIESNQYISDFLSMKNNKNDGSYILEFTRANGVKESRKFGYYTNGGALDNFVEFEILNDTIIRKFSGTGY